MERKHVSHPPAREQEGMSTRAAGVFTAIAAPLDEPDPVPKDEAAQRMTDDRSAGGVLDERMAALAGVFGPAVPFRHDVHAVPEDAAEVPDALVEPRAPVVWITSNSEQQRMPALHAGVFPVAVSLTDRLVRVVAQEARQGMTDADDTPIVGQATPPATRAASARLGKDVVIDRVSPEEAEESTEHHAPPSFANVSNGEKGAQADEWVASGSGLRTLREPERR